MNNNDNYIGALILKFAWGEELSEEEQLDLNRWRSRSPHHQALPDLFADAGWVNDQLRIVREFSEEKVWQNIIEKIGPQDVATASVPWWRRPLNKKLLAAAGVIGVIVGYLYLNRTPADRMDKKNYYAMLTLSPNHRILLDTAKPGRLDTSPPWSISKLGNDTLDYEHSTSGTQDPDIYHQVTVDTGSTMHIHLPDGTWVSLSNASTIRYPVTNIGDIRECFLEGKGSFNVMHDPNRPFIVHMDSTSVKVLGTTFNISAYKSDSVVEIILYKGSVQVKHGEDSVTLDEKSLRQARIINGHIESSPLSDSVVEAIMSWQDKDPRLHFVNTELKDALRMISLRYGKGIRYKDSIRNVYVTGTVPLSCTLKETIQIINDAVTKIHVEDEGDSLTILAKK